MSLPASQLFKSALELMTTPKKSDCNFIERMFRLLTKWWCKEPLYCGNGTVEDVRGMFAKNNFLGQVEIDLADCNCGNHLLKL